MNLGALKFLLLNKLHIFQSMGKIFCVEFHGIPLKFDVEFHGIPLKFDTKYLTHTLKDAIFYTNLKI